MRIVVLFLVLCLFPISVMAGDEAGIAYDGNQLYAGLKSNVKTVQGLFDSGVSHGFILGVVSTAVNQIMPMAYRVCLPEGTINQQLFDVTERYLESRPQFRHHSAIL